MSLSRYPDYKHSGVDWLGEVPSHWKIERLKNVIDLRKNTVGETKGDYTLLSLTLQGVIARNMVNPKGKFPAEFNTYQVVEKDDLVFCLFDVEETPRAVGISPCTGMVTGAYTVGRVKIGTSAQYLYNFYLSRDQYKAFKMYYTGLRNVIRSETFNAIPCPVPPIDEQIGVAKFLAIETEKIDILVTEQEKLIELLVEKRHAVISHAVTKGLDSNVEVKDSGVEWLGEIPKHWILKKLKYGYSVVLGKMLQPETSSVDDELLPYLRATNIQWKNVNVEDVKKMWLSKNDKKNLRLVDGDLLVSEGGDVGRSCIWRSELEECYFQNSVNRIRAKKSDLNMYLYYWIFTIKESGYIDVLCNKSTIAHFTAEKLENVIVPFPPVKEQTLIVNYLDKATTKVDTLIFQAEKAIKLLNERRSALISAAVTGQIDVRNYQPEETA
jgi:type I restriction enzyme S subunit